MKRAGVPVTKRSRSVSSLESTSSASGGRKRHKGTVSPEMIHEEITDSESPASSSKTEAMCSPSSSSRASQSEISNRESPEEDEAQTPSSTSSNEEENRMPPPSSTFIHHSGATFRRFSKVLDRENLNRRALPPQLTTVKWGSPQKVWNVLCNKKQVYKRSPNWCQYHPDLNEDMRFVLLEWLMEVSDDLSLERESFYLAIDYIDRFFSLHEDVRKSNFQLVGATALFLAAKNEEIEPPRLNVFVEYSDGAFTEDGLRKCELIMLHVLDWQMNPITPLQWLRIYMQLMGNDDIDTGSCSFIGKSSENTRPSDQDFVLSALNFPRLEFLHLAKILDLCVLDPSSLAFEYSVLSAAIFSFVFGPDELTEEVTGFKLAEIAKAREFVKPYWIVCERHRPSGQPIKMRNGVCREEMHNIQFLHPDLSERINDAKKVRRELMSGSSGCATHSVRKKLRLNKE